MKNELQALGTWATGGRVVGRSVTVKAGAYWASVPALPL